MLKDRKSILASIKPTAEERQEDLALANKVINLLARMGLKAELVGSVARGTALKGKKDLDVFVMFDKGTEISEMEKTIELAGKKVAKSLGGEVEKHYAQHPYIWVILRDRRIELVPAYKIKPGERVVSAVDRTPLHNEYLKTHLKNPDDVLLLKWFMKQIGVYGAEIEVHGFSGYLCELLVVNYGSFEKVIEEASVWEPPVVIDIEGHYDSIEEVVEKFKDPLIVVDPVDKSRNVASPVSLKNLGRFTLAARKLVETGTLPRSGDRSIADKKLIVIRWAISKQNEEIIWGQLESYARKIARHLDDSGFKVKEVLWWTDSESIAEVLLDLENDEISGIELRIGPSVFDYNNAAKFISKYKNIGVNDEGRLYSERHREIKSAKEMVLELAKKAPEHIGSNAKIIDANKSRIMKVYKNSFWSW